MSKNIQITAKERYVLLKNWAMNNDIVNLNQKAIDAMIEAANDCDIEEAVLKADLKKLNRKYSAKLIKNKEKYEPVVAKIRTILETL
jgi:hypothetical protein